jgi:hypothetical protein
MSAPASTRKPPARRPASALAAAGAAVATLLLASACGASSARSTESGPPAPSPVGSGGHVAEGPCASKARSLCVTERARGHTVELPVGWTLTLGLGAPGRRFGAPSEDGGDALQPLGQPRRSGSEVIASFRAVRPGTVQLRSIERPACRAGSPCPDYLVLWMMTVRVNRRP